MGILMQIVGIFDEKEEDEDEDWTIRPEIASNEVAAADEVIEETDKERNAQNPNIMVLKVIIGVAIVILLVTVYALGLFLYNLVTHSLSR
jgi:hypothetical protein